VNILGGSAEASASTHLTGKLEAAVPFMVLPSKNLWLVLWLFIVLKGKLNVELQSVPDALPHSYPLIWGSIVAGNPATTVDPGSRASRCGTSLRCGLDQAVLHAGLAVPRATRWHSIEASAEDMRELLTAVTVHQLRCIAELVAHHARVIAAIVFECVVVFLDDHGRVDVGDLLLVWHGVFGKFGA
jgi:hypothetical protein